MPSPGQIAGDRISDKLDQSGWFNDVTHNELKDINAEIDGLNPNERIVAIGTLSDSELETWTDEMDSNGWFGTGGLSDSEKKELFDDLAEGLDANQLQRVYNALGDDNRSMLSESIAAKSGDQTKIDFISELAPRTTEGGSDIDAGLFHTTTDRFNHDARNAAKILASMDGTALSGAMDALADDQLGAVLTAATNPTMTTYSGATNGAPNYAFDTERFTRIAENVAQSGDAELKGRFFQIGAEQIAEIRDTDTPLMPNIMADDDAGEVAAALTNVLESDVTGVVTALESNQATPYSRNGKGMSLYMAEMMRQGNLQEIHDVIEKLQQGNDLQANPTDFLSEHSVDQDGNRNYQNLSNLGYVVGSVRAGVEDINADLQEKADILNNIFSLGIGTAGKYIPSAYSVATQWGTVMVKETVKEITDQVKGGHLDFGNAIEELAIPSDMTDSDFEGPFGEAIDRVIRNN